jgi:hypothetical protein
LILLVLGFTAAGVISCLILNGQLYGLDTCDTWNTGRLSTCNITQLEAYSYTRDICNSQRYGQNNNVCHRVTYNGIRYGVTWINDDAITCAAQLVDQYSSTWSYSLTIGDTIPCCASSITCQPIHTNSNNNNNNNSVSSSTNMGVISDRPIVPTPYDHEWHLRVIADHTSVRLAYAGISFGIVFGMIPLAFILATRCHSLLCDDALPHMPTMSNLSPPPPLHQQYPQYVRAVRVLTPAPNRASMMYTISPGHVSNVSTGSNPMTSSGAGGSGVSRRVTMDGIPIIGRERTGSTPSAGSGSNTPTRSPDGYHHRNGSNEGTPNSNGSSGVRSGYRRGRHNSHGSMGAPGDFDFAVVEMEPRFNDELAEDDEHPSP